jgi:inosine/xanthosine triphosphatase
MSEANSRSTFRMARSLELALAGDVVRVGTENRAKLRAVHDALTPFQQPHTDLSIVPVGVSSDVPEQPIGWSEIVAGARNRARAAFASGRSVLAVGIEDGLVEIPSPVQGCDRPDYYNVGCAWVTDGARDGHGFSSGFAYPPGSLEPAIRDRAPIGDLFDALWRNHRPDLDPVPASGPQTTPSASLQQPAKPAPSGGGGGNIGLLTGGRLERAAYGSQAVVCALVRFLHTDLYD